KRAERHRSLGLSVGPHNHQSAAGGPQYRFSSLQGLSEDARVGLRPLDLCVMPTNVCLIIPCFNETERLDFRQLGNLRPGLTCLLVDDGSEDGTGDLIHKHESASLRLLRLGHNVGKAEAIRQGMLYARANGLLEGAAWVGYWDADLAAPL